MKCFILPYFGFINQLSKLSIETISKNVDSVFVFTDDKEYEPKSKNILVKHISINELSDLIERKLGTRPNLKTPYKLCDLKFLYPIIFDDYVNGYELVAFGDSDCLYGSKISEYFDSISSFEIPSISGFRGHFMVVNREMINNTIELLECFFGNELLHRVIKDDRNYAFDEFNFLHKVLEKNNQNGKLKWIKHESDFSDISYWKRIPFCVTESKFIRCIELKDGKVMITYDNSETKSVSYVHFQKRKVSWDYLDANNIKSSFNDDGSIKMIGINYQSNIPNSSRILDFSWRVRILKNRIKSKLKNEKIYIDNVVLRVKRIVKPNGK